MIDVSLISKEEGRIIGLHWYDIGMKCLKDFIQILKLKKNFKNG